MNSSWHDMTDTRFRASKRICSINGLLVHFLFSFTKLYWHLGFRVSFFHHKPLVQDLGNKTLNPCALKKVYLDALERDSEWCERTNRMCCSSPMSGTSREVKLSPNFTIIETFRLQFHTLVTSEPTMDHAQTVDENNDQTSQQCNLPCSLDQHFKIESLIYSQHC